MENNSLALDWVLCIQYPVWFKINKVCTLINSGSKINALSTMYALKLGQIVRYINVGAQQIDGFTFETFGIVLVSF